MLLATIRHFPLAIAFVLIAILQLSVETIRKIYPNFGVQHFLMLSFFAGIAILIWIVANTKKRKRLPLPETEE